MPTRITVYSTKWHQGTKCILLVLGTGTVSPRIRAPTRTTAGGTPHSTFAESRVHDVWVCCTVQHGTVLVSVLYLPTRSLPLLHAAHARAAFLCDPRPERTTIRRPFRNNRQVREPCEPINSTIRGPRMHKKGPHRFRRARKFGKICCAGCVSLLCYTCQQRSLLLPIADGN